MKTSDEQNEILIAFALGSLDEAEASKLVAQMASDKELAADSADWQNVAANLALLAPVAEPAPEVRENIFAAIGRTPQTLNPEQNDSNVKTTVKKPIIIEQTEKSPIKLPEKAAGVVSNFPARSKTSFSLWNFAPTAGAIAASIVALLLGISLYNTAQSNKTKNEQIAALNQKVSETEAQLARERQERELLASPATFIRALDGTKELPTAKARLVFDPKTGQALLYVEGLPAAPQGKAYQIWFISDPKKPAPGKTFETDNNGKGVLREQIPAEYTRGTIFAVTLEPDSGSPAPTTSPLLLSAIS